MSELRVCQMGLVPYADALALQERLREDRLAERIGDTLLLLEHPPVITRGRRSREDELVLGEAFLREHGFDVVTTQRGGLATYHGPGMLVGYPIVRTDDVVAYLRSLEQAIVGALAEQGVSAHRRESTPEENLTGVWVGGPDELRGGAAPQRADGAPVPHAGVHRKIASLGVHVSRGVAIHGFAIGARQRPGALGLVHAVRAADGADDEHRRRDGSHRHARAAATVDRRARRRGARPDDARRRAGRARDGRLRPRYASLGARA